VKAIQTFAKNYLDQLLYSLLRQSCLLDGGLKRWLIKAEHSTNQKGLKATKFCNAAKDFFPCKHLSRFESTFSSPKSVQFWR
jgi:hypothetical protein